MYTRPPHAEKDLAVLRRLIAENPLGSLTTAIESPTYPFLQLSFVPFLFDAPEEGGSRAEGDGDGDGAGDADLGRLRCHLARQNSQSKAIIKALQAQQQQQSGASSGNILGKEVMVVFQPVQGYVTPRFYKETKAATGKVVPTWNYTAVQIYGKAKVFFDPSARESQEFLGKQINDLTNHCETNIMGYTGQGSNPMAWKVSDAPERYIELRKRSLIGLEIIITRMEGKFKMSQDRTDGYIEGVIEGFDELDSETGRCMAGLVQDCHHRKNVK
ncbi:hypothetical protein NQ176_g8447 [Zarea fungicola]|uniref:Uncharacterized protein n=1 Tax=Zarea fungicola TaxID=93591 RepID=A0ACC1MT68_9HYPO|nr:hypothetical protein NQ176_g8447 [Lecanicillium fungicola]